MNKFYTISILASLLAGVGLPYGAANGATKQVPSDGIVAALPADNLVKTRLKQLNAGLQDFLNKNLRKKGASITFVFDHENEKQYMADIIVAASTHECTCKLVGGFRKNACNCAKSITNRTEAIQGVKTIQILQVPIPPFDFARLAKYVGEINESYINLDTLRSEALALQIQRNKNLNIIGDPEQNSKSSTDYAYIISQAREKLLEIDEDLGSKDKIIKHTDAHILHCIDWQDSRLQIRNVEQLDFYDRVLQEIGKSRKNKTKTIFFPSLALTTFRYLNANALMTATCGKLLQWFLADNIDSFHIRIPIGKESDPFTRMLVLAGNTYMEGIVNRKLKALQRELSNESLAKAMKEASQGWVYASTIQSSSSSGVSTVSSSSPSVVSGQGICPQPPDPNHLRGGNNSENGIGLGLDYWPRNKVPIPDAEIPIGSNSSSNASSTSFTSPSSTSNSNVSVSSTPLNLNGQSRKFTWLSCIPFGKFFFANWNRWSLPWFRPSSLVDSSHAGMNNASKPWSPRQKQYFAWGGLAAGCGIVGLASYLFLAKRGTAASFRK